MNDGLYQLLVQSSSQISSTQQQQEKEQQLLELEKQQGILVQLLHIICTQSLQQPARWLASIRFKNVVQCNWKSKPKLNGKQNVQQLIIGDEEKQFIRQKLLESMGGMKEGEGDALIWKQLAVAIAKIARTDFPAQCPDLFDKLKVQCGSAELAISCRAYNVMQQVIKELSRKRLKSDMQVFEQLTQYLFQFVWDQFTSDSNQIISWLQSNNQQPQNPQFGEQFITQRWIICMKIIKRFLVFGSPDEDRCMNISGAIGTALNQQLQLLHVLFTSYYQSRGKVDDQFLEFVGKGIVYLIKTEIKVLKAHQWSVLKGGVLGAAMELFVGILGNVHDDENELMDQIVIKCMVYLTQVLQNRGYSGLERESNSKKNELSKEAVSVLQKFWLSNDRLKNFTNNLISHYLKIRKSDLEEWQSNEELYFQNETFIGCPDKVRSAAKLLFREIMEHYGVSQAQLIQQMFKAVGSQPLINPEQNYNLLLSKESVYTAVALSSHHLVDSFDFTHYFRNTLVHEITQQDPLIAPLKCAALHLIANFASQISHEDRQKIYQVLNVGICEDDIVVSLTASQTLSDLVSDWEFNSDHFKPFLKATLESLSVAIQRLSDMECLAKIFNSVNLLVNRMSDHIQQYAQDIAKLVMYVWEIAKDKELVKIQLIEVASSLVNVLESESVAMHALVVPMIRMCIEADANTPEVLLQDGFELWLVSLRNAPDNTLQLFQFFPSLCTVMTNSTEYVHIGMQIMRSCILLGGANFLQNYSQNILEILCFHIGQVKEKGMLLVYAVMELIIQMFPEEGFRLLGEGLVKVCRLILAGGETQRSIAAACTVLSRICINNPQKLVELAMQVPSGKISPEAGQSTFFRLVNLMLDSFDVQSTFDKRKIVAISAANFLTVNEHKMLGKLSEICASVTSVSFQSVENGHIQGIYPRFVGKDYGDYSMGQGVTQSEDADCELLRWQRVCENDPVQNVNINEFFKQKWQICHQMHKSSFENVVNGMDASLSQHVQNILALS